MGELKKNPDIDIEPWFSILNLLKKKERKKEKNTFLTAGSVLGKRRKELDYGI